MRYVFAFISVATLALCCSCGGGIPSSSPANTATAPWIAITPSSVNLAPGSVRQFGATVMGLANTAVVWSIQEGAAGGSIDPTGKYTAPATVGTYHVVAQSQARASVTATAAITVYRAGEAQGVYTGTYSYALALYAIILPDDMFYSIEGSMDAGGAMTHVFRVGAGEGMSLGGNYTADLGFSVADGGFSASLQAQYVPATSLTGSVSNGTFSASVLPTSQLDFNTPANLSHITGSWTGLFLEDMLAGEPVMGTLMISPTGEITSLGCYSGVVTPDANRNFFNVRITVAQPCTPANQTMSGVAVEMLQPDGVTRQLLIVVEQASFGFAALR